MSKYSNKDKKMSSPRVFPNEPIACDFTKLKKRRVYSKDKKSVTW